SSTHLIARLDDDAVNDTRRRPGCRYILPTAYTARQCETTMPVLNPTRACIRLRIALLVLLAAACDGSNNQTQPPPSSASSTLPGITEVPLTIQEADLPDLDPITVAVTSTGHFGYVL